MVKLDAGTVPVPDADSRPFWEYARKHELRVQRCTACGHHRFPPGVVCPECQSFDFEWRRLSGKGTVYSWEVIHHQVMPVFFNAGPMTLVMVEPEETDTVRLIGNFVGGDPEQVRIGLRVEAVFEDQTDEVALLHWRPATPLR